MMARFLREPPVRKTPLHDPVTCPQLRQGVSHTFLPAYPPATGTVSSLSPTTWLPHGPPYPPHTPLGLEATVPLAPTAWGAAVSANTGRRRAARGTMSVRAVRRLTVPPAPLPPIAES